MKARKCQLSTAQLIALNNACKLVTEAMGQPPYLVGSVEQGDRDWRDVDVRSILDDEDFDALFTGREFFWSLFCFSVSEMLSKATGLPVDFQVQRRTEANEKFGEHPRNPLGMKARLFAGGGDAKPSMGSDPMEFGPDLTGERGEVA